MRKRLSLQSGYQPATFLNTILSKIIKNKASINHSKYSGCNKTRKLVENKKTRSFQKALSQKMYTTEAEKKLTLKFSNSITDQLQVLTNNNKLKILNTTKTHYVLQIFVVHIDEPTPIIYSIEFVSKIDARVGGSVVICSVLSFRFRRLRWHLPVHMDADDRRFYDKKRIQVDVFPESRERLNGKKNHVSKPIGKNQLWFYGRGGFNWSEPP